MIAKIDKPQHAGLKKDLERIEANGMLLCQCSACDLVVMLAETTAGLTQLFCPHCHKVTLKRWGKVDVTFVPED